MLSAEVPLLHQQLLQQVSDMVTMLSLLPQLVHSPKQHPYLRESLRPMHSLKQHWRMPGSVELHDLYSMQRQQGALQHPPPYLLSREYQ